MLERKLAAYAGYHRDPRNVVAHLLGIPQIVFGAAVLLSRPVVSLGGMPLTLAMLVSVGAVFYYLTLDFALGGVLAVLLGVACWAGLALGDMPPAAWLTLGGGLLAVGWLLQFIGHGFEGRRPAFVDDLTSLAIGPLFIVAEVCVLLGFRRELKTAMLATQRKSG